MATEMKRLKLGTVCLDGTKIHANASRHSALSHGHIVKLEAQLRQEVQALLELAEDADTANIPDGMSLPKELKLRKDRLGHGPGQGQDRSTCSRALRPREG